MGQKAGKAAYKPESALFLNLSLSALEALWEAFNDVADGEPKIARKLARRRHRARAPNCRPTTSSPLTRRIA